MTPRQGHDQSRELASRPRASMADALGMIRGLVARSARVPPVVAITGPVGSGKSTLASLISTCIIPTDAYLPDYHTLPEHERDLPQHAELDLLAAHLDELRRCGSTRIPVWSFQSHRREGWKAIVLDHPTIVVEGIHAFDDRIRPQVDLTVLVEADRGRRWARWEAIESAGERGWGVEKARAYFETVAEPTFNARIDACRETAALIVFND